MLNNKLSCKDSRKATSWKLQQSKKWNKILIEKYVNSNRVSIISTEEFNENLTPDVVYFNGEGNHNL